MDPRLPVILVAKICGRVGMPGSPKSLFNGRGTESQTISLSEEPTQVLGLVWRSVGDGFSYEVLSVIKLSSEVENICTKRDVIKISSSIFDPLGFISPIVINAKMLFQQLWERGVGWDDRLPEDLQKSWNKWTKGTIR